MLMIEVSEFYNIENTFIYFSKATAKKSPKG